MLNRRWMTFWRLLRTGKFEELLKRIFRFIKTSINKKTEVKYSKWRNKWVELDNEAKKRILRRIKKFTYHPSFTLIIEFDENNESSIITTVESVIAQLFPNWVLCINNYQKISHDNLKKITLFEDSRIKLLDANSIELEDWVLEIKSGTTLHEAALFASAVAIIENPEVVLIYSDQDHIDNNGNYCDPYLKPDWNSDLFAAINYISPFVICKKELWRSKREKASNQYNFLLQVTKQLQRQKILHLPYILASDQIYDNSHLHPPVKRVNCVLPNPPPKVSILIPTRDQGTTLERCLESLLNKTDYSNFEVILIDHETKEPKAVNVLTKFATKENIQVLTHGGPFNFSAMINRAAKISIGQIIVLLNNDTEVIDPHWLKELVSQAVRHDVGVVGNLLLFGDGTIQHAGVYPGLGGLMGHGHKHLPGDDPGYFNRLNVVHEVAAVTGACMAIKKSTWDELDGLDEENLPVAYNDIDLCLKARERNLKIIFTPFSKVCHHESVSRGVDDAPERNERLRDEINFMQKKWGTFLKSDTAYNPNLEMSEGAFKLAKTPRTLPLSEF